MTSAQDESAARALQLQQGRYGTKPSTGAWFPAGAHPNTHLGSRGQQELDALRLPPQARLVQRGDGVVGDRVDAGAALYQLLQLQDLSPPGRFVNRRPVGPEACRGGIDDF